VYRSADSWHLLHPLFFSSLISASLLYFCFPEWILRFFFFCISVFPNVCQLYHPFHPSLFSQSSRNHARNVIPFFSISFLNHETVFFVLWISPSHRNGSPFSCSRTRYHPWLCQYPIPGHDYFIIGRSHMINSLFFHCISSCVHTFLAFSMFLLTDLLPGAYISLNWPLNTHTHTHIHTYKGKVIPLQAWCGPEGG